MTELTASCLRRGDVVQHRRYHRSTQTARVAWVEPRSDAMGYWVVVEEMSVPMSPGRVIGDPPRLYRCAAEDLDVVAARRGV